MAKISFLDLPVGFEDAFKKVLAPGDRFTYSSLKTSANRVSRYRKKEMLTKNLIPILAPVWQALTQQERDLWNEAGTHSNTSGWILFLRDKSARIANGIEGYASPENLYQVRVGNIHLEGEAQYALIAQIHPKEYYVQRKKKGTHSQLEQVKVTENFSLPLNIEISYKTDFVQIEENAFAKFYVRVFSSYQGRDIETDLELNFGLSDNWMRITNSLNSVLGLVRSYIMYIEVSGVQGDLWFDNIVVEHSGHNWARDPFCYRIHQDFTKQFYQIPKHWSAIELPEGAFYQSVYYN